MLQRLWRCTIDPARAHEYEEFARITSIPMFKAQPGYRGCIMGRLGPNCEVLTLWEDETAVRALERSQSYLSTVAKIRAAGFLRHELGTSTMITHQVDVTGNDHVRDSPRS